MDDRARRPARTRKGGGKISHEVKTTKMTTYSTKPKEIRRDWHLFDAKDKILGRLVTQIASILMGKNKPYFSRHLDCGGWVVVLNASQVKVTGKKEKGKIYYHHSGYSGGLRKIPLERMRQEHPERIIEHAVSGMLPDNKLKKGMLKRLKIFVGEEHPYKDKFKARFSTENLLKASNPKS